jgi:hypothetical protein
MLAGALRAIDELAPHATITSVVTDTRAAASADGGAGTFVEGPWHALERASRSLVGPLRDRRLVRIASGLVAHSDWGQAIGGSDLLLFAGGGYLNANGSLSTLGAWLLGEAARRGGVPWALFGHSVGPFREAASSLRATRLLEGAEAVAIREPRSAWEASSIVPGIRPEVVGDLSLLLQSAAPPPDSAEPLLAVCARDLPLRRFPPIILEPDFTLGDAVTMLAKGLRARVAYVEAAAPPAHDDREANEGFDRTVSADVERADRVAYRPGGLELPPASLVVAGSYHVCLRALARGMPAIAIATSEFSRHMLRGLFELFGRADWVWTPELGIPDLVEMGLSAAGRPKSDELRQVAADLGDRQRGWLARHLPAE